MTGRSISHIQKAVMGLFSLLCAIDARNAYAFPESAVQTAQSCNACHFGGFGPQITPAGRQFELERYTLLGTQDFVLPVSAMAVS